MAGLGSGCGELVTQKNNRILYRYIRIDLFPSTCLIAVSFAGGADCYRVAKCFECQGGGLCDFAVGEEAVHKRYVEFFRTDQLAGSFAFGPVFHQKETNRFSPHFHNFRSGCIDIHSVAHHCRAGGDEPACVVVAHHADHAGGVVFHAGFVAERRHVDTFGPDRVDESRLVGDGCRHSVYFDGYHNLTFCQLPVRDRPRGSCRSGCRAPDRWCVSRTGCRVLR